MVNELKIWLEIAARFEVDLLYRQLLRKIKKALG